MRIKILSPKNVVRLEKKCDKKDKNRSFFNIKGTLYHFCHYLNDNCPCGSKKLRTFAPEFKS